MVAEGWELFEQVVNDAGAGGLPQLPRSIKTITTPPLATPPPKMDVSGATPSPSPVKKEHGTGEEPVWVKVGGKHITLAPSVTKSQLQNTVVMLTLGRCIQEKPLCVPFAGFPPTIWTL